jgi:mRNA interferase YafQ
MTLRAAIATSRFRRDVKRLKKRGTDLARLVRIIQAIQANGAPPAAARPHLLLGAWAGHFECHVAPDWLLIYQVDPAEVRLYRTGTHSDLFG